ncbi:homocysteine S-methyltransferase family protein [Aliiroseovarius sp. PrR006]|uniref:homocysteine S-methyltransferase family protein n=1 Tax=Aliiroseovarius sp. PrR006 TaxID=2706883 RepID=UPI0013D091BC|nr:homocysteine S-methyltransferase family protein [Aliiroseovarius sp. PrR006]NDW53838.1 homocysteine S-methyltransferase [Aliiroseovarius sp. PrR006]
MALYRDKLPQLEGGTFLAYTGMETDLLFTQGIDLPGFASYPLLETEKGRKILRRYFQELIEIGKSAGVGVILESPTWVANRDRGAAIGYAPDRLVELSKQAVALMADVRSASHDLPTLLSANIGPRDDAYAPGDQMNADEATAYHSEQVSALAETDVDLISGYTVAYPAEAVGMVLAAKQHNLPVIIAFTVETDGRLPTGATLKDAIEEVDAATDSYACYFMINCAHPDHFDDVLTDDPWMQRLKGIVANASRCSHAELDEAEELDDGDPMELGQQLAMICAKFPQINIVGGCCGTDSRHLIQIADAVSRKH